MPQETEQELVASARAGDAAAFERLVRPMESRMLAVAAGFAHTPDDADDIYQDAMLAAYRALPKFKAESRFGTWLHRIVVNTALSNRRRLQRAWRKLAEVREECEREERYIAPDSPESALLNSELGARINEALNALTDKERMAFVLCHQQGFRIGEAAEITGSTDGAVKVALFRAREKLKARLGAWR